MTRRALLRASDADREQVVERLRRAATEGRLHDDELEERLGAAFSARTYGELDLLVSDLPIPTVDRPRPRASRRRPAAAVAFGLVAAMMLVAALGTALTGHDHEQHNWGGGVGWVVWLVWVAIGLRLLLHRRRGLR